MKSPLQITVYGRKEICPSCVGAPGSWDTFEWLQAAIGRKFGVEKFRYTYIDMDQKQSDDKHREFIEHIIEEDRFYPVLLMNNEIIAEGNPNLKTVFNVIESYGIQPIN
ncbi:YuzD family protein [Pseudogracilibacillus sp. SE30717A]|uniref:YuzD family protein n=1 Tax=Pseudogracilibacillus sp. SE30717A TaxID=3098293 RepID=UPI00300E6276